MSLQIVLASASPARLELLNRIGISPDLVVPSDIDETEIRGEKPHKLASRLAIEKARSVAANFENAIIIGADTVPVVRRIIMRKASNSEEVRQSLRMLSHRRHFVYTGVCIIYKNQNIYREFSKLVKTTLKFKKLSTSEIEYYCTLGQGEGKAGGYSIAGYAESFISFISGSYSNVMGLPLFEVKNIFDFIFANYK